MSDDRQKLDFPSARKMVAEILQSDPGAKFGRGDLGGRECEYFHDGEPACVIGHVFSRIGITLDEIEAINITLPHSNTARFNAIEPIWDRKITLEAAKFLDEIQTAQDDGLTWGEIYEDYFGEETDDEATGG